MDTSTKILVLYLQYSEKYKDSFSVLRAIMNQWRLNICYYIIDNGNMYKEEKIVSDNIIIIPGDNSSAEFSGWQCGIEFIKARNIPFGAILLINDSFLVRGKNFIQKPNFPSLLEEVLKKRIAVGYVDRASKKHVVLGINVTTWIRTNAVLLSKSVFDEVDSVVAIDDLLLDLFIPTMYQSADGAIANSIQFEGHKFFKQDAPLNEEMKKDIVTYLTQTWHSKFEINEQTWSLYRMKVKAILNEVLFTANLRKIGIGIRTSREIRLADVIRSLYRRIE